MSYYVSGYPHNPNVVQNPVSTIHVRGPFQDKEEADHYAMSSWGWYVLDSGEVTALPKFKAGDFNITSGPFDLQVEAEAAA